MKVLFIWQVPQKLKEYLEENIDTNIELIFPTDISESNLVSLASLHQVDVIVGWRPSEELLLASKRMKLFQNPGAGVQHLIKLFKKHNIQLANCHGNSYFTAQHGVALLLSLANTIIVHDKAVRDGLWRDGFTSRENIPLRNNTIGILGLGHVGLKVAQFLSGFESKIIACKRSNLDDSYPNIYKTYGYLKIEEFFAKSDIIISTLPSTKETTGLINKRLLLLLGKNGLIVNIGRGDTFVEEDLFEALSENIIAGAALDVFWHEADLREKGDKKYPFNLPFDTLDNVILSPHRAASPMSDLNRWDPVIENISNLYHNRSLINIVDLESEY